MNRAVFANHVLVADVDPGFSFGRKAKILRSASDDRTVTDEIICADGHITFEDDVRSNDRFVADLHVRSDHRVRSDFNIGADLRGRINNRS